MLAYLYFPEFQRKSDCVLFEFLLSLCGMRLFILINYLWPEPDNHWLLDIHLVCGCGVSRAGVSALRLLNTLASLHPAPHSATLHKQQSGFVTTTITHSDKVNIIIKEVLLAIIWKGFPENIYCDKDKIQ